jgi:hypothetical protein
MWIFISLPLLNGNKEECLHLFILRCFKQYLILLVYSQ